VLANQRGEASSRYCHPFAAIHERKNRTEPSATSIRQQIRVQFVGNQRNLAADNIRQPGGVGGATFLPNCSGKPPHNGDIPTRGKFFLVTAHPVGHRVVESAVQIGVER
jgi:hypothetical protein